MKPKDVEIVCKIWKDERPNIRKIARGPTQAQKFSTRRSTRVLESPDRAITAFVNTNSNM